MAREREDFRPILEDILTATSGKRLLNIKEAAEYCGVSRDTMRRRFAVGRDGITAVALARKLAALTA